MGVKGRKLKHYSGDFKCSAIEEVLINHLGLRETGRKYGVTHKMVQTWIKMYLEKGKDYLYNGVAKHTNALIDEPPTIQNIDHIATIKVRKPKHSKVDGSSLPDEVRDELNMLRMENAYLKKLNALVRKKEKSQIRTKLK